jgi:hypothetical protein
MRKSRISPHQTPKDVKCPTEAPHAKRILLHPGNAKREEPGAPPQRWRRTLRWGHVT